MASDRYSRILHAALYAGAVDKYIEYLKDVSRRGSRVGQGSDRPESIALAVTPFAFDLGTGKLITQSASKPAWESAQAAIGGRTKEASTVTAGNLLPKISGYKAARVNVITGRSQQGTVKTSNVTGLKYLSYGGKSISAPFGKGTSTETQQEAFTAIKAALTIASRVYLIPEKI